MVRLKASNKAVMFLSMFLLLLVLVGCAKPAEQPLQQEQSSTLTEPSVVLDEAGHPISEQRLITPDGKNIVATYYKAAEEKGAVILLHMLGLDRSSWNEFAEMLQDKGYAVLSIDLRGHGQSEGEWKQFSSQDFNAMVLDVKAAKDYLESQDVDTARLSIIGASIGSNIALKYAATDNSVKTVVLLSPGIEYRGVKVGQDMLDYDDRPLLIVASSEDEYSARSSEQLLKISKSTQKELKMYDNAGHGTNMFEPEPGLMMLIGGWLDEYGK